MRNRLILLAVFSAMIMFILSNCTYQYTREFISVFPPDKPEDFSDTIQGWIIDVPGVVAYKNLKTLDAVSEPDKFWFTIRTRYPLQKNIEFNGTLEIDSIGVIMYGVDSSLLGEVNQKISKSELDFVLIDGSAMPLMRIDTVFIDKRIQSIDTVDFHHFDSEYFSYSYSIDRKTPSNLSSSPIKVKLPAFNNAVAKNDTLFVKHSTVWRSPSRVAPFIDSRNRYQHIAFDFFREKGVIIPDDIVRIKLFFQISLTGASGKKVEKELQYYMLRYETSEKLPFIMQ